MGISFNKNSLNLNTSQSLKKATTKADNLASKKIADTAKQAVSLNKSSVSASSFDSAKVFEKEPDMPDKPKPGGDGVQYGLPRKRTFFEWLVDEFCEPWISIFRWGADGINREGNRNGDQPGYQVSNNSSIISPKDIKLPDKPDIDIVKPTGTAQNGNGTTVQKTVVYEGDYKNGKGQTVHVVVDHNDITGVDTTTKTNKSTGAVLTVKTGDSNTGDVESWNGRGNKDTDF